MIISPYSTTVFEKTTYRALIACDDGVCFDVKSTNGLPLSDEEWGEIAQTVLNNTLIAPIESETNDSPIEQEFKKERDEFKISAIGYVHSNPQCSLSDVLECTSGISQMISHEYLINLYILNSFSAGIINDLTFDLFRDFICSLTVEQIMEM